MGWVYLISLILTVLDTVGSSKYYKYSNEDQAYLRRLKQKVDKDNAMDYKEINRINGIINSLSTLRYQLDPRVIKTLDTAINKFNDLSSKANESIQARTSGYENAVASIPNRASGILGIGEKSLPDKIEEKKKQIDSGKLTDDQAALAKAAVKSWESTVAGEL